MRSYWVVQSSLAVEILQLPNFNRYFLVAIPSGSIPRATGNRLYREGFCCIGLENYKQEKMGFTKYLESCMIVAGIVASKLR